MDITNTDSKVRDLEHVIDEKEREIQMLRDSIHEYNNLNPVDEERIKEIECQVKEIDGLVRGLTAEMLDLKACIQKLSKSHDEGAKRPPERFQEKNQERAARDGEVASRKYPAVETSSVAAARKPAEPVKSYSGLEDELPEEVMIIQPDGTMKKEVKKGDDMIIADHRGGGVSPAGRRGGDPRDRKPLIYADDDDTVEIKRRRK
ncbi:hypothetical protein F1737_07450 [Methanoplanus sp. FWC-SCC4]|uniref:Uncharacterized protein n=1 Tax=Methanochimaera problematica TaxID=2609417 RepID=A0AA97FCI1_9EURY|nr:hypothetical protein [Methanoplanus sp. FWC-SCC4]WOF16537.1 hypothetical protein F1737_07450 [Methanoplanus sp. FWC-SCC4]